VSGALALPADRALLRRRWYAEGWYGTTSLADEMRLGAESHPGARMIFHSDVRPAEATLAQLYQGSLRVAAGLAGLGVARGDVVAIQVPNWLEGALCYQAAMILGAVIVPIVHIYGPAEVGFILRQSGARVFIVPDRWRSIDYLERVSRLGDTPDLEHLVVIGERWPAGAVGWAELDRFAVDPFVAPVLHPDEVCLLVYTSGTTAAPKGVCHTHNSLLAEVKTLGATLDTAAPTVSLAAFPAGHIAGVLGLTRLFVRGATTVLMDVWDPAAAAALVDEHGVTSTSGTPFHLTTLLDAAERDGRTLATLGNYMVGAAGVPPAVVERAAAAGIAAYRAYGSSEHPTITSGRPDDPLDRRAATDGRLLPGSEIVLVDDDGTVVPAGREGEIVSRGPDAFAGYRDAELDATAFLPGGWFRTGDVGRLDGGGFLTITDRRKDVIIRGGENISSKEVEDILAGHPSVAEAAVVAVPDPTYGERVCAFVTLRDDTELDLEAVRRHFASTGVARQKTPERLEVVGELPRTAAGKVKKFELRDRLRDAGGAGERPEAHPTGPGVGR